MPTATAPIQIYTNKDTGLHLFKQLVCEIITLHITLRIKKHYLL